MLENKKLIILFFAGLAISVVLLMPVSILINTIGLPEGVNLNVHRGNIWQGSANVYFNRDANNDKAATSETQVLLMDWQLCAGGSFPFISYCLDIKSSGNQHSVKIVGFPGDELTLENIKSKLDISVIAQQLQVKNLALLKVRGSLNIAMDKLELDLLENTPILWDGRITLDSGGFFNVDFPQIVLLMRQQSFISRGETNQAFGNDKLPTIIIQGNDDTMTIDGTLQILPDKQVKLNLEILARTELVEQTFAPLATNRDGRKLFITYQGPLG
ncbi:MAG: hypothetical protein HAW61_05210 [Candidatus Portiera sp.]|nr:hypothetical protein [Portiera sp.]